MDSIQEGDQFVGVHPDHW